MADIMATHGRDKILLFRLLKDAKKNKAAKLAYQVEHTLSYERSTDATQTKDGAIVSSGGIEVTMEITAVGSSDELNDMLKQSVVDGDKLEVWEVDLTDKRESGKYGALYMQGNLNSWEAPASAEDLTEISTTLAIDGLPVSGEATLTAEQEEKLNYLFRDTLPLTEEEEEEEEEEPAAG